MTVKLKCVKDRKAENSDGELVAGREYEVVAVNRSRYELPTVLVIVLEGGVRGHATEDYFEALDALPDL